MKKYFSFAMSQQYNLKTHDNENTFCFKVNQNKHVFIFVYDFLFF